MQGSTPRYKDHSLEKGLVSLPHTAGFPVRPDITKHWETLKDLEPCFPLAVCNKPPWIAGVGGDLWGSLLQPLVWSKSEDEDPTASTGPCLSA